jgi:glucose/arabinose dehydrogenase
MPRRTALALTLAFIPAPLFAQGEVVTSAKASFRVETVASGLENPWALVFLPDGRKLITERPGRLRILGSDGKLSPPVAGLPAVAAIGQGGLLDVALAPDFAQSRMIYFSFAEPRAPFGNGTSVARARLVEDKDGAKLDDLKVIFRQQPAVIGGFHFGSRLAFARDGTLFVTLGERHRQDRAQDLSAHLGKVVRIRPDGTVPPDNPFVGRKDALPEIWSFGHRNPQGAAIHPTTGKLWIHEHGPRGGDEVNIPEKGKNYGWPVIGYGTEYSGARIHASSQKEGMEQPIHYWVPISIAPSGMAFYTGNAFPNWRGNLFIGALAARSLVRLELAGEKVVSEEKLLANLGARIRDVRQAPDGTLWLLTDARDGKVLRLVPANTRSQ